ncbi:MAG: hypothetical protein ACLUG4_04795 [Bacilli bacterium]|jgi:hypothetical protein|nr:hypothetical protein [Staphylococcus sp.]
MNKHEFTKPNPFNNDMKKKFDDNTEFAKEFTNPYDDFKKAINIDNYNIDDELLEGRKNKAKK